MFLKHLQNGNQEQALSTARAFVASLGTLQNQFDCAVETTDDFGGKKAAFLDLYPQGADFAKDHKKFGGIFVRVWVFGEPQMVTYGIFLGAERAEQSEPRRGVAVTRRLLGQKLVDFENSCGFSYHTWSSGHFTWTTKSSRAVARQLEQFVSFRQDSLEGSQPSTIEDKVGQIVHFLDQNVCSLKPIKEFGKSIIHEYYSENLPERVVSAIQAESLGSLVDAFDGSLSSSEVGLRVSKDGINRLASCLLTKRFLILTGLSGSGKTKVAQAFARWITPRPEQIGEPNSHYVLVPVGADWTGNENVLGYPNGLDKTNYVSRPALDLIIHARTHANSPHFLILDEMNLSHVERYFADVLSAIESAEELPLYQGETRNVDGEPLPRSVRLPNNMFIIGTVNVDETTYMFSPKVLDRANVIEFRMEASELKEFLRTPFKPDLAKLDGQGQSFGDLFINASNASADVPDQVKSVYQNELLLFFNVMQAHGAEFGYRLAYETARFIHFYKLLGKHSDGDAAWFPGAFDCVVFQKLLPKLHGSRAKLGPLLKKLWFLCVNAETARGADALKAAAESATSTDKKNEPSGKIPSGAPYPLSADKIARMWRLLNDNGFASFAEA